MIRIWIITPALILLLSGCATLADQKGFGEEGSTGSVSYNSEGLADLVEARRKSAVKKMREFCTSGKFKVISETTSSRDPLAGDDLATTGANKITNIKFSCL